MQLTFDSGNLAAAVTAVSSITPGRTIAVLAAGQELSDDASVRFVSANPEGVAVQDLASEGSVTTDSIYDLTVVPWAEVDRIHVF